MRTYHYPAEWSPQKAVWMIWPYDNCLWPTKTPLIRQQFAHLIRLIANETSVVLLCPSVHQGKASEHFDNLENIVFVDIDSDDVWCRDSGPFFIKDQNGEEMILDWDFNAWGGKYHKYSKDDQIPQKVAQYLDVEFERPEQILEGGAIDVNGAGLLITTESVLLNKNRGQCHKEEYLSLFKDCLGVDEVIWLKSGLVDDETDGHVDNVARFISVDTVLIATCREDDSNFDNLQRNKQQLENFRSKEEGRLTLVELPLPNVYSGKERLSASYCNFLITNDSVFVPIFDCPDDENAVAILRRCFPEKSLKTFNCLDILEEGGAIHCLTQPQFS